MARKVTRADERKTALLNALRVGNTRSAAAAFAEIGRATLYRWLEDETFRDTVEKAEAEAEARFVSQIAKAAQDGTWTAAAWWLERRRWADYGRKDRVESKVEMSGPGGAPLDGLGSLSDHEKRVLRSAIRAHLAETREPSET